MNTYKYAYQDERYLVRLIGKMLCGKMGNAIARIRTVCVRIRTTKQLCSFDYQVDMKRHVFGQCSYLQKAN